MVKTVTEENEEDEFSRGAENFRNTEERNASELEEEKQKQHHKLASQDTVDFAAQ